MIYYSKGGSKLLPQDIVVLEHREGEGAGELEGQVVLSRDVYERLVLLRHKFCDSYLLVERKMSTRHQENAVKYFAEHAPSPVNIIAPFLHLIKCEEELPLDMEVLCGYLHVISNSIEFDLYLGVTEEVRKSVLFSYRQVSGYVGLWKDLEARVKLAEIDEDTVTKDFIQTLVVEVAKEILGEVISEVKELAMTVAQPVVQGAVMQPSQMYIQPGAVQGMSIVQPVVQEGVVGEEEPEEDMNTFLQELLADELDAVEKENTKQEEEEEPEEVEEEKVQSKENSVIDNIIAMYGGN